MLVTYRIPNRVIYHSTRPTHFVSQPTDNMIVTRIYPQMNGNQMPLERNRTYVPRPVVDLVLMLDIIHRDYMRMFELEDTEGKYMTVDRAYNSTAADAPAPESMCLGCFTDESVIYFPCQNGTVQHRVYCKPCFEKAVAIAARTNNPFALQCPICRDSCSVNVLRKIHARRVGCDSR
jgi:hypothetical protein